MATADALITVQFQVEVSLWHRLCWAIDAGHSSESILTAGMNALGCPPEDPSSIHETVAVKFPAGAPVAAPTGDVEDPASYEGCRLITQFRLPFWPSG